MYQWSRRWLGRQTINWAKQSQWEPWVNKRQWNFNQNARIRNCTLSHYMIRHLIRRVKIPQTYGRAWKDFHKISEQTWKLTMSLRTMTMLLPRGVVLIMNAHLLYMFPSAIYFQPLLGARFSLYADGIYIKCAGNSIVMLGALFYGAQAQYRAPSVLPHHTSKN